VSAFHNFDVVVNGHYLDMSAASNVASVTVRAVLPIEPGDDHCVLKSVIIVEPPAVD